MTSFPIDLLFFAVMAVVLLFHFNSILGKGDKNDIKENANPQGKAKLKLINNKENNEKIININELPAKDASFLEISKKTFEDAIKKMPKKSQEGIEEIKQQDKTFSTENFITGAMQAFGLIVLGYARGNINLLKKMLDEDLFEVFKEDIKKRKKGEKIDTKIENINKIQIEQAKLQGSMAYITVKFVSNQTTAVRNEDGEVLKGDPEQPREITDIWTFAKDIRSENPNWTLVKSES